MDTRLIDRFSDQYVTPCINPLQIKEMLSFTECEIKTEEEENEIKDEIT